MDSNGLTEPQIRILKWRQGYPDLVNRTIKSQCESISALESFFVVLKLVQVNFGVRILPIVQNEIYASADCSGAVIGVIPLIVRDLYIENNTIEMVVDNVNWELDIVINDDRAVQHFEQVQGPFGSEGRVFVFTVLL